MIKLLTFAKIPYLVIPRRIWKKICIPLEMSNSRHFLYLFLYLAVKTRHLEQFSKSYK